MSNNKHGNTGNKNALKSKVVRQSNIIMRCTPKQKARLVSCLKKGETLTDLLLDLGFNEANRREELKQSKRANNEMQDSLIGLGMVD